MRRFAGGAAALLVLVVGGLARGQLPPICDGAIALRVNERGLAFVADLVKPHIPSQVAIPAISEKVVDWPVTDSDAVVHISPTTAFVTLHQLSARMDSTALRIQGKADIVAQGPVDVDNPYVGLGSASCQADVQLRQLELDIALELTTEAGVMRATVREVHLSYDNPSTVIALGGCMLGDVLTAVLDFVREHFAGAVEYALEEIARDKLAVVVASKLGETIQVTKETHGFRFTGRLDGVQTDAAGVAVFLGAGVGLTQPASPPCLAGANLAPPTSCAGAYAQLSSEADTMFGAALSEAVLNQALHAVWRSGALCVDSAAVKAPSVAQGLQQLSSMLGQPKGTQLSFALRLGQPPRIRLTSQMGVELALTGAALALRLSPPGGPPGEVGISADVAVGGTPWIDPVANVLLLDLSRAEVSRLQLLGQGERPSALMLDPARVQRFISTVAMPLLREQIAELPLSPAVVSVAGLFAELKGFRVEEGYVAAYIDAYQLVRTGDKMPPNTTLVRGPGSLVGPQVLRLVVSGADNRTPTSLLRYRARVDGGPWGEPRYGGRVDITVHGGTHVMEVAAVDHDDNSDPSPTRVAVTVDDVMPEVTILSRPESIVRADAVQIRFSGRDDRTPPDRLSFVAELHRVPDGGGASERLQQVPGSGGQAGFAGLGDGVYKIRVVVADEAGNVTSADAGFVIMTDEGCAISPGCARPPAPRALGLVLLLLPVLLGRRRVRR